MKYTIEQIAQGEDELILRYRELSQEVQRLMQLMRPAEGRLVGASGGQQCVIDPADILYVESVDRKTFVYTSAEVLQVDSGLAQLELMLSAPEFFRCSKSMILNIDKVKWLKSLASNRIDAQLVSGEHIIISRTYASDFRKRLKGGA